MPSAAAAAPAEAGDDAGKNPQGVHEYAAEIYGQMYREEAIYLPRPDYMESQTDINGRMRAILIDWLVEVHMKYRLRMETLFLAVNLIDRYLTRVPVMRRRLQLVGVVAMFVAAKFEEISPPEVQDFVYITDNAYSKEDILVMECTMLTTLGFSIACPTVVHFLERLLRANGCSEWHRQLVQYLVELALLDLRMVRHMPSLLAAAALLLSNELFGRHPVWPAAMAVQARHGEDALSECAEELRALLRQAPETQLQAVQRKFSSPQHQSIARSSIATTL